ncbi:hypothetical protein BU26DRAFT_535227 [Trematosphaeria pertusa]|uniref:DUF7770 domain-containing protein n=1 Tax=Trematosphaeria pertusa TaxID=390896 RepID=A0A6A6HUM8_9PLEO|nr:uncharacterized protein BU26DRAFT_535227 [Trematosphaeria pertusa]KAF2241874.1 hypothetical protein BU26DRAFT_535227 [Trematosphaeria pertusa]
MPNGDLSQNHWTIYLLLNGSGSVQINMKTDPRPSVVQGVYEVTRRSYRVSNGCTMQEISSKGWHRYNMTAGGVGCRHWVLAVLRGLAARGWVDANDIETQLVPALQFNYSKNTSPIPLKTLEGSFY